MNPRKTYILVRAQEWRWYIIGYIYQYMCVCASVCVCLCCMLVSERVCVYVGVLLYASLSACV